MNFNFLVILNTKQDVTNKMKKTILKNLKIFKKSQKAKTIEEKNIIFYDPPKDESYQNFSELASIIRSEERTYLKEDRLFTLWQALNSVREFNGECIEVGTFRGGSAKFIGIANRIICNKEVKLTVIDTFEGHPECIDDKYDRKDIHFVGKFNKTSYFDVVQYLKDYQEIDVVQGDCMNVLTDIKFSQIKFAHIDVDLYRPILHCLKNLDKYMIRNGVVVVDDYSAPTCPGVEKAINEFLLYHKNYSLWFFKTEQAVLIKQ